MNIAYSCYNSFGSIKQLEIIGKHFLNERASKAALHYGFKPEKIAAGAFGASVVVSLTSFILVFYFNPLVAVSLSAAVAFLSFLYLFSYLPNKLRVEQLTIAKYTGAVLQEFYFALSSTGSIFDALRMIELGDYPYISEKFREIICMTHNGHDPEQLLLSYAYNQPSIALQQGLVEILSSKTLTEATVKHIIDISEFEIRSQFQGFSLELESRVLVFVGISFFTPLIFSFSMMMLGLVYSPLVFLVVPVHTVLIDFIHKKLTCSEANLLG